MNRVTITVALISFALGGLLVQGFHSHSSDALAQAPKPAPTRYQVDDTKAGRVYANFFRITATPEEMIIDLGLNPSSKPTNQPIRIEDRVILSYFNAKRLSAALMAAVRRHEQLFGTIETDIKKRLKNNKDLKAT